MESYWIYRGRKWPRWDGFDNDGFGLGSLDLSADGSIPVGAPGDGSVDTEGNYVPPYQFRHGSVRVFKNENNI